MPHVPRHYNIRPQPTQSFVPTPKAQIRIPTMGMTAGLNLPLYGGQIPTMLTQGKLPAPSKPTTPSPNLGVTQDASQSLKFLGERGWGLTKALGRAVDPLGGTFQGFLQGRRGTEMFDPQSLIGAGVRAATAPDMGGWQRVGTALQPVANVFGEFTETLKPLQYTAAAPLLGAGWSPALESGESFNTIHKKYRDAGYNWLEASVKAGDELDLHESNVPKGWIGKLPAWAETPLNFIVPETVGVKGAMEVALDPFVLIPVAKGAGSVGRRALGRSKAVKEAAEGSVQRQGTGLTGEQHTAVQLDLFDDVSKTTPESQLPPKPRTGELPDAHNVGEVVPAGQRPLPHVQTVKPLQLELGLPPTEIVVSNLGKGQKLRNWVGGLLGDNKLPVIGRLGIPTASEARIMQYTKAGIDRATELAAAGRVLAKTKRELWHKRADDIFGENIDRSRGVEQLTHLTDVPNTGIPIGVAPTITDVAARLPRFWNKLNPDEKQFFRELRNEMKPYDDYVKRNGWLDDVGERPDVTRVTNPDGTLADNSGFYISRGGATEKIVDGKNAFAVTEYPKLRKSIKQKDNDMTMYEAQFDSQAQGVNWVGEVGEKLEYKTFADVIHDTVNKTHLHRASDFRAQYLNNLKPNAIKPRLTHKQFLEDAFAAGSLDNLLAEPLIKIRNIRNLIDELDDVLTNPKKLSFLRAKIISDDTIKKLDEFINNPIADPDDILPILKQVFKESRRLGGGFKAVEQNIIKHRRKFWMQERYNPSRIRQIDEATKKLNEIQQDLQANIRNTGLQYKSAINKIKQMREKKLMGMADDIEYHGIPEARWIDDMADEIKNLLDSDPVLKPKTPNAMRDAVQAINGMLRGLSATMDNSANGITLLFGSARNPEAWALAYKGSLLSFKSPKVLANHLESYNKRIIKELGIDLDTLINNGLHISGGEFEFSVGQMGRSRVAELSKKIEKLPIIRQANRAFSNAGDIYRTEGIRIEIKRLLAGGRTMDDLIKTGDLRQATRSINRISGYSEKVFAGDFGELLLFAPRFFQSRLENLFKGIYGTGKVLLKPVGVATTLEERLAAKTLASFIGYGTSLTFAINFALGNETDLEPFKEITTSKKVGEKTVFSKKWIPNPNFMAIRFQNRDWNLFGSTLAIVRMFGSIASAAYQKDPKGVLESGRGVASPTVARAWDVLSGTTFMGQDADLFNLKKTGQYDPKTALINIGEQFFPFAIQDIGLNIREAVDKGQKEGVVSGIKTGVISNVADLSGFPQTPMSLGDLMQDVAVDNFDKNYQNLESYQKKIIQELIKEKETPFNVESKQRISDANEYYERIDAINEKRWNRLVELGNSIPAGRDFVNEYYKIIEETGSEKGSMEVEYENDDINSSDPNKKLMAEWYALYDMAKTKAGNHDSNMYKILIENFLRKATPEQRTYIERNTNQQPIPPAVLNKLRSPVYKGGHSVADRIMRSHAQRQIDLRAKGKESLIPLIDKIFFTFTKKE